MVIVLTWTKYLATKIQEPTYTEISLIRLLLNTEKTRKKEVKIWSHSLETLLIVQAWISVAL